MTTNTPIKQKAEACPERSEWSRKQKHVSIAKTPNGYNAYLLAIGLILLLAAFLRFYRIDVQSLWADEGNSVAMAPRAVTEIVQRTAQDIHPPLYYLALHGWVRLFGTGEAAIRGLSALFGVATVALTAALGQRIGGRSVALFAALAAAVAPFAIHYSQEARMYAMVTTLAAASWLFFVRLFDSPQPSVVHRPACPERSEGSVVHRLPSIPHSALRLPYFLLTLAMLYTHYYAVSVVVAQNVAWLWGTVQARRWERRWWAEWVAVQAALVAAYLPWLWYARATILNWPAISPDVRVPDIADESFRIFSLGLANDALPLWAALGFGLLFLLGITIADRLLFPHRSLILHPSTIAFLYFAIPPLLMVLLSLDRPFWNPKFLLLALPGYHLILALGAAALLGMVEQVGPRFIAPVGAALVAFLVLAAAPSLHNEYWEPQFWRDDYRAIARTIAARATPADAVLLDGPGQREIFDYYYQGSLPRYGLPATRPLDEAATVAELEGMAARHERLFAVWWAEQQGDPALLIPRWLEENAFEAGSRWFGDVRLATYQLSALPPPEPLDVTFSVSDAGATLQLRGASVQPERAVAGDIVAINSVWEADNLGEVPVTFFAQLLDASNHIVGQYDGTGGAAPPAAWNERQTLRLGVPVAVGAPPGDYALILGAYRSDNGQRLLTPGGDSVRLATVRVEKPVVPPTVDALALPPGEQRDTSFGELRLVGARANKLGFDHAPETPVAPGEPLSLLLHWQAQADAPTSPPLTLRLRDAGGAVVAEWPHTPTEGHYSTTLWGEGELVRDAQVRFLPPNFASGTYRLSLESGDQRALITERIVVP